MVTPRNDGLLFQCLVIISMTVHHTGTLRELPGIAVCDVILIEVELERMILPKKMDQQASSLMYANEMRKESR